jgi:hypothetical protein
LTIDMSGQRSPVGAQPNFSSKARMISTGIAAPPAGLLAPAGAFARRKARDHG